MTILKAVIFAIVHGIAEFLPISSSGHLMILEQLFKIDPTDGSMTFLNAMLHLGTLCSVLYFFKDELKTMLLELVMLATGRSRDGRDENGRKLPKLRLILLIVIGTLPVLLVFLLRSYVQSLYSKLTFVAFAMLVTGMIAYVSDKIQTGTKKKDKNITVFDAVLVGCAQLIGVIPGLSRSGTTVVVGAARGLKRSIAVKFSLLLSIPAAVGLVIMMLFSAITTGIEWSYWLSYLLGFLISFVVGVFSIGILRGLVERRRMRGVAYYVWLVGAVTLVVSIFA